MLVLWEMVLHMFLTQNSYNVNLIDISEESLNKALITIAKNLDRMVNQKRKNNQTRKATDSKSYKKSS